MSQFQKVFSKLGEVFDEAAKEFGQIRSDTKDAVDDTGERASKPMKPEVRAMRCVRHTFATPDKLSNETRYIMEISCHHRDYIWVCDLLGIDPSDFDKED